LLVSSRSVSPARTAALACRSKPGIVWRNALRAKKESTMIARSEALASTGNEILGFCTTMTGARDVQITENLFERSVRITGLRGSLLFARNPRGICAPHALPMGGSAAADVRD